MADELDPRLGASLRAALHQEADQLPLLVTTEDVERARRRRRGRHLAWPASLLGLAAVMAILVATGVVGRGDDGNVAGSPAPSATARPLVSYEDLAKLLGPAPAGLLRAEHPAADPGEVPVSVELGSVSGLATLDYAVHCLGGSIDLVAKLDGNELGTIRTNCSVNPLDLSMPLSLKGEVPAGPVALTVTSRPEVRWRIVVAATATSPADRELESMADLEAALVAMAPAMPVIARGEHLDPAGATGPVSVDLGPVSPFDFMNAMYDCAGGDIRISVMDGEQETSAFSTTCDTASEAITDGIGSTAAAGRIVVTADAAVRWRVVVSALPSECVALNADATDRTLTLAGGERPTPIDATGTLAWHTVDGATISGDPASLPALGGPLAVNLADGLIVDPGQHCFDMERVEAGILPRADYEAARTSGAAPSFTDLAVKGQPEGRAVTVPLIRPGALPAGGQVIRFRAAWHRSDGKEEIDTWLIPVEVTRTGIGRVLAYEDLAVYAEGTVELLRAEHAATSSADQAVAGEVGETRSVEIVLSCDTGTVTLGFRSGDTTYPATATPDCGQGETSLVLDSPVPDGTTAELLVTATAGTTWRLIAYDHAAHLKPSIEDALPLPAPRDGQTVEGIIASVVDPASRSSGSLEVYAGPQGTTFEVVYACEGAGSIHVTVEGLTKEAACSASGSLSFTPSGFGPSVMTVTSDQTVRLHLELRSTAP